MLHELKDLGVQIALDDFGCGHSTLYSLKRLPVDALKIDRSFVKGLGSDKKDTAIVSAVVALAHALNLSVTGEGIETAEWMVLLGELGCELGQGNYLAEPLPVGRLLTLLESNSRDSVYSSSYEGARRAAQRMPPIRANASGPAVS